MHNVDDCYAMIVVFIFVVVDAWSIRIVRQGYYKVCSMAGKRRITET